VGSSLRGYSKNSTRSNGGQEAILKNLRHYLYGFIRFIPGNLGSSLRVLFYRCFGVSIGKSTKIAVGAQLDFVKLKIGSNVYIGEFTSISAGVSIGNNVNINTNVSIVTSPGGSIEIHDDVLIAQNVVIRANDHVFESLKPPINMQGHTDGKIIIERDVWLGANVVVTRNTQVGESSVIGAQSVITKNIPPYSIAAGVPAKVIKSRV
jgi:acetyltransferase-like isoleucine patch superfamily enzyme